MKAIIVWLMGAVAGCAAHTANLPLGEGKTAYDVTLGGPVIAVFGANIPTPQLNLGIRHGLRPDLDLSGHVYLTAMLYRVVAGDIEATSYIGKHLAFGYGSALFASSRPAVGRRAMALPEATLSSAWEVGARSNVYFGEQLVLTTGGPLASSFLGSSLGLFDKANLLAEARWTASNRKSDDVAVTYASVKKYGALGLILGVEVPR